MTNMGNGNMPGISNPHNYEKAIIVTVLTRGTKESGSG